MIKVRGYMFSRDFMGERVPQHVQNLVIRNYCNQNKYHYLLSAVEYVMDGSYLILKQILQEIKNLDGIGFYSIFQLPYNDKDRIIFLEKIIKKKKFLFFCSEGFVVKNRKDVNRINTIWLIKKNLNQSLKNFSYFKFNK